MKKKVLKQPTANSQQPITVLVTGANGQLGLTFKELYEVNEQNIDFIFVAKSELDITKEQELKQYFKINQFDYCVNCAAYTNVEQAEKTPEIAYKVNAEGVEILSEACKDTNTILIHISTDYVFDGEKIEPYAITDKPNPINEYGKSKLLGEQYIQELLDKYFIVRTSWLYSKNYGRNFYRTILEKAKTEKELFVTDEQKGCPTNTENLANYIINMIIYELKNYGIKHFSDENIITWYNFAEQILKEHHLLEKIRLVKDNKYITFAERPQNSILGKQH